MTLREGRKRQVRRMAEAVGNEVEGLTRSGSARLSSATSASGEARRLEEGEVAALWEDAAP